MLTQIILETLAATQPVLGAVYYWRQRKSVRASMLELRRQGLTIDQLAGVFKVNRSTVIKRLAEYQSEHVAGFISDQSEDWQDRYRKWCCEQKVHYELGACAYCDDCKKKAETAATSQRLERWDDCHCEECRRFDSYSSSSSSSYGWGDSSSDWSGSSFDGSGDLFGPLR